MKFSTILPIIASLSTVAFADNLITAIVSDINGNLNQYLSYIAANNIDAGPLISLYRQVQTYTDDSYTTLANPGLEASLSAFATGLPWYSERLAGGDSTPASSTAPPEESSTSSAVETTSSAEETSSVESSVESSSAPAETSSAPAESSPAEETSSAPSVIESEGAGNSLAIAPLGVAMAGAIALLM
ncbi:hypothetical protein B5S28_g3861 [[Candida] boidinii]|uniref:Unnamed protein product n=1 Tax=Candida boidinii TaxID=5477 RepID=A0ACB5TZ50_CANBO|nr:hypothetical protein B5S28_g3861 [[Candida] boidinii]OWB62823.1 hypothetical protein B5S29_g3770 [[Candida] boidinii]OWB78009.1 hypothetical protein B5S32_g2194 [[Candida] boidinii]GME97797.1 unnamed protein product [[Candida] boidinii]GMF30891.1 unnamed protein product [[Candida] boidinii]